MNATDTGYGSTGLVWYEVQRCNDGRYWSLWERFDFPVDPFSRKAINGGQRIGKRAAAIRAAKALEARGIPARVLLCEVVHGEDEG